MDNNRINWFKNGIDVAPIIPEDIKWPDKKVHIDIHPDYYKQKLSKREKTGSLKFDGGIFPLNRMPIYLGGPLRTNPPKKKKIRSCTERNYMR